MAARTCKSWLKVVRTVENELMEELGVHDDLPVRYSGYHLQHLGFPYANKNGPPAQHWKSQKDVSRENTWLFGYVLIAF